MQAVYLAYVLASLRVSGQPLLQGGVLKAPLTGGGGGGMGGNRTLSNFAILYSPNYAFSLT